MTVWLDDEKVVSEQGVENPDHVGGGLPVGGRGRREGRGGGEDEYEEEREEA